MTFLRAPATDPPWYRGGWWPRTGRRVVSPRGVETPTRSNRDGALDNGPPRGSRGGSALGNFPTRSVSEGQD